MKLAAAVLGAFLAAGTALAQPKPGEPVPVTVDNFRRAESDLYFGVLVKKNGAFGKVFHKRDVAPIDHQDVIRENRDTLYSAQVFDLDAGPVTITLPDAGKRFMSLQMIDGENYTQPAIYGSKPQTFTRKGIGTRYVLAAVRTLVNSADPKDLEQARALQDAIKVEQPGGPGKFEAPHWDPASQKKVREALLELANTGLDARRAFGPRSKVDPVQQLIGTAWGWGGNPPRDATYLFIQPPKNDGKTVYRLDVKDVPVDGFWSVSVYNAKGYYEKNPYDAYALNNLTAKKGADGLVSIQFGGCDGKIPNCLPTMEGWNYAVRLYRPRAEILNGKWKFPAARPAN